MWIKYWIYRSSYLDEPAGLVGEEVGGTAERIELEVVADEFGEGVEAFAHVAWLQRDIDLEASVESEHGVSGFVSGSGELAEELDEQRKLAAGWDADNGTTG